MLGDRFEIAAVDIPPLRLHIGQRAGAFVLDGAPFMRSNMLSSAIAAMPIAMFSGRRGIFGPNLPPASR